MIHSLPLVSMCVIPSLAAITGNSLTGQRLDFNLSYFPEKPCVPLTTTRLPAQSSQLGSPCNVTLLFIEINTRIRKKNKASPKFSRLCYCRYSENKVISRIWWFLNSTTNAILLLQQFSGCRCKVPCLLSHLLPLPKVRTFQWSRADLTNSFSFPKAFNYSTKPKWRIHKIPNFQMILDSICTLYKQYSLSCYYCYFFPIILVLVCITKMPLYFTHIQITR